METKARTMNYGGLRNDAWKDDAHTNWTELFVNDLKTGRSDPDGAYQWVVLIAHAARTRVS
jgi:hypothetical protein